ncbi:tRNA dihydrouridine synthase DusB [Allofournierella sp.]|uniref:tRNA dihydrouridine synthase DusB n=1 Tax=Allofournierella sp. TaxID=1940256 RepID=UPI003AB80AF8
MQIGSIQLAPGAALAPMAGFTDAACRRMAARHGAAYTISEMVSAKALTFGDKKSAQLIGGGGGGAPYGVQLFGAEPETMERAAALIQKYTFEFIDINMGCPAPKITSSGAGSRLLLEPERCGAIVAAVVKESGGRPVTVKMRTGWDAQHITAVEASQACEAAGAAAIAVHGRTREQMYTPGTVDPGAIAAVKAAVKVPVVANGDIESAQDALDLLAATGCDGVMVGRAALGDPWMFEEIKAALAGEPPPPRPTLRQKLEALRTQIYEMCEEKGEWTAMPQARSQALYYMKGLKGAAALRRACCELQHFEDVDRLIEKVYAAGNR